MIFVLAFTYSICHMTPTKQEMIDRRYSLECDSLGVFYDDDSIRDMVCSGNNIRFVCVKRGTYQDDDAPMEIKCKLDNNNRNHLTDRGD